MLNQQNETKASEFLPFIHIIRAASALLVVWSHLVGLWIYKSKLTWSPWIIFYNYVMEPFQLYQGGGHLGVVLFFLISGYIISFVAVKETRLQFLVKRVLRIFPPLFLAVAILVASNEFLEYLEFPPISGSAPDSLWEYVFTATLLDRIAFATSYSLSITWTLVSEIWFYAVVLALIPYLRKYPVSSTLAMLFVCGMIISPEIVSPYFSFNSQSLVYLPVFIVGRVIYLNVSKTAQKEHVWILGGCAALMFFAAHEARYPGQLLKGPIVQAFTYPTALLTFLGVQAMEIRTTPAILRFFGDISYSLYLLHIPVGFFVLTILAGIVSYWIALPVAFSAAVAVSCFSYYLVEKPSQNLARMIIRKSSSG